VRVNRWLVGTLGLVVLALAADVGRTLLTDWRIRLRTLIKLDPPPAPYRVERDGLALVVTGAVVRGSGADGALVLRAWIPTPAVRVVGSTAVTAFRVRVENVPARATLAASGPAEELRTGLVRTVAFDPRTTGRLGFTVPDRDVTFALLGDTGNSHVLGEALIVAGLRGADFFIHAGDVVYEDWQMPSIRWMLDHAEVPVYVARGNHDYRNAERIAFMRSLGPAYYVIRMGGATIVVLDNGGEYLPTFWRRSTQYRWWQSLLGESRPGPFFVAMHKPPFDRRTGPKYAPMLDKPFARQLMADFRAAGVDAVLTGHVHETHWWVERGIPYVVSGEGMAYPERARGSRMAWVEVRGWQTSIEQVPIWRRGIGNAGAGGEASSRRAEN
jgi:predicted phosphodiesterase